MNTLEADLNAAIIFFTTDFQVVDLPFMHDFPKNCCEVASSLLACALQEKYPNATITCVAGFSEKSCEQHHWIMINNILIDPTIHQFPGFSGFSGSLVSVKKHPLGEYFPVYMERSPHEALKHMAQTDNSLYQEVVVRLTAFINFQQHLNRIKNEIA
jgi:hypothetical protein